MTLRKMCVCEGAGQCFVLYEEKKAKGGKARPGFLFLFGAFPPLEIGARARQVVLPPTVSGRSSVSEKPDERAARTMLERADLVEQRLELDEEPGPDEGRAE